MLQTTVDEALIFSSRLRFTNQVDNATVRAFVDQVSCVPFLPESYLLFIMTIGGDWVKH